jgi:hypothetical protein
MDGALRRASEKLPAIKNQPSGIYLSRRELEETTGEVCKRYWRIKSVSF